MLTRCVDPTCSQHRLTDAHLDSTWPKEIQDIQHISPKRISEVIVNIEMLLQLVDEVVAMYISAVELISSPSNWPVRWIGCQFTSTPLQTE